MENEHGELDYNRLTEIFPEDRYLNLRPELGNSMYDHHADGTGVCYSSRLRPILNFRPKHGSLWQLSADMHLVDWLESNDIAYDVLTDEDLHAEGVECLRRYRCVMTCTHPEYYSTPMWNALYAHTQGGGRLMYLGGNGFYWRVAFRDDKPGAMEMRRAEDGSRSWIAEPGEYYMAFTGELGGMWWRCGGAPQYLVGNGFIAQGFDFSSYYRRNPDSFDPRARLRLRGRGFGRADRRLRADRRGRRRHRARHLRSRLRDASARVESRLLGEAHRLLPARQRRRRAHVPAHRRPGRPQGARGHRVLRDAERRRGVLHRLDRLVLRPLPPALRQQRLADHPQRAGPLPGCRRPSTTAADASPETGRQDYSMP